MDSRTATHAPVSKATNSSCSLELCEESGEIAVGDLRHASRLRQHSMASTRCGLSHGDATENHKNEENVRRTPCKRVRNARGTTPRYSEGVKVLTVKETAHLLKVRPQWVYRMLHGGGLPSIRLGRQIRIDEESLEKWLAERRSMA